MDTAQSNEKRRLLLAAVAAFCARRRAKIPIESGRFAEIVPISGTVLRLVIDWDNELQAGGVWISRRLEGRNVSREAEQRDAATIRNAYRPRWDAIRRELWCGKTLIKRYRRAAQNQERVLAAFEAAAWPDVIDDPLPEEDGIIARERMWDTIKQLNRTIKPPLIHFGSDGTGRRVCWRPNLHA